MTQEEIDTITRVAKRLSHKYTFDVYDEDDIFQEAFILGMDCLERYDSSVGPLENFVATHISNRLKTLVKKHSVKPEPEDACSLEHIHWFRYHGRKKLVKEASTLDSSADVSGDEIAVEDTVSVQEIRALIDKELPVEFRADFLKMVEGLYVPKQKREQIKRLILEILDEDGTI